MNEIKETLAILKARLPEVILLIGLGFLHRVITLALKAYPDIRTPLRLVSVCLTLFMLVVSVGFLRTVYLKQGERRSIPELVRTGKHFLWRFLSLAILGGIAMMIFFVLVRIITGDFLSPLAIRIMCPIIMLIFARLFLLVPATIIVTDSNLSDCFRLIRKIKLLKAKPLVIFFLIVIVVLPYLLLLLFPGYWEAGLSLTWSNGIFALYSIISHIMGLMISVMAVRFVASVEVKQV